MTEENKIRDVDTTVVVNEKDLLLKALAVIIIGHEDYLMTHDYKAFEQACYAIRTVAPTMIGDTPPPLAHRELMNQLTKGLVKEAEYVNRMFNSIR
jgi:hypothetical protein